MMLWCELHPYLQGVVLAALFVTMSFALCLMPSLFRHRSLLTKILLCMAAAVSFAGIVLFGSGMKASYYGLTQTAVTLWAERLPALVPVLVCIAVNGYLATLLTQEIQYRKNTITPHSLKESLDHLPAGLCFYDASGTVMLANYRMYELCQKIVGRDLQNAALFWDILSQGTPQKGVERLGDGEQPSFRLPEGTVWSFTRSVRVGVIQLMAADITQLQQMADDLTERNLDLAERNLRLQNYSENMDRLAREQEQLDAKARIHSQFGQALLVTRHYLRDEDGSAADAMNIWAQTKESLRSAAVLEEHGVSLQSLRDAARAAGLTLEIRGSIPKDEIAQKLLIEAALEAMTNAVRHAQASLLYFEITENDHEIIARFANDGKLPADPVAEGGGLGALRLKAERVGGTMRVDTTPAFALVVTVPKGRSWFL